MKIKYLTTKSTSSHWVKSVQTRSFFGLVFSCVRTEYGDFLYLLIQSKHRKIRTRKNSVFVHLLRSELDLNSVKNQVSLS